jgi:hypothetical protein
MAKKIYTAQNEIRGLEAPRKDKGGSVLEHVLKAGEEYEMEEKEAEALIAGGALILKGAKTVEGV